MSKPRICPECRRPLPDQAPGGLCPACLLRRGLESNTFGDSADPARWTPPPPAELASRFPELEVLELVGRGGMGAVYKARQKSLDRLVALKILPPEIGRDPAFAERFAREAQAMARLNHPHIVSVHEFGERDGVFFFLMEYVDGLSLAQLLAAGNVRPKEALAIVPQICDALQFAHDRGIVHRDIKPGNILLNRQGQVKIADFGLAKLMGRTAEGESKVMGTPCYIAPEQVSRPQEVDHRADIYSLGVVFYQMLTGELPKNDFIPPSRKVQIDVRLDDVVLRALEHEPARRYQQVREVKTMVETIVTSPPPAAPPPARAAPRPTLVPAIPKPKPPWWPVLLVTFVHGGLLLVAALGLVLVVPRFTDIYRDLGMALPLSTQALLVFAGFVANGGFLLLLPLIALNLLICRLTQRIGGGVALLIWALLGVFVGTALMAGAGTVLSRPVSVLVETLSQPSSTPDLPPTTGDLPSNDGTSGTFAPGEEQRETAAPVPEPRPNTPPTRNAASSHVVKDDAIRPVTLVYRDGSTRRAWLVAQSPFANARPKDEMKFKTETSEVTVFMGNLSGITDIRPGIAGEESSATFTFRKGEPRRLYFGSFHEKMVIQNDDDTREVVDLTKIDRLHME